MQKLLAIVSALTLITSALLPAPCLADGSRRFYPRPAATVLVGGGVRHGGHFHGPRVGVHFGAPFVWGWPWGWPAYYPPAVAYPQVVAPPDVVYVEKSDVEQAPGVAADEVLEPGYWYYCRERNAYYPAVIQCSGAWEKVPPIRK